MAVNAQAAQLQGRGEIIPFRRGTRQHFDIVGDITYASNRTGTPRRLNQVGFLNTLIIRVTGTMTLSAAGALAADGPWNLVRRIRVTLNTGIGLVTLSGFGAFLVGFLLKEEFAPNVSGRAEVFSAPVAVGANAWNFMLQIPIAANDGQNFEVGLINLQTEELVAQVEIDWAPELDAVTLATGFVGRADVFAEWYEVPDPTKVRYPPLNILHRFEEQRSVVAATGDNRTPLLRQGTLLQLLHVLRLNGVRNTTDLVALRLELNRSDRVYRYELAPQLWEQALRYGQDLPVGVFAWDWWHAQMDVSQGDGRDFVDTEAIAQIDSVVEVATGAVLGSNNNFVDTIRRFTQVLIP